MYQWGLQGSGSLGSLVPWELGHSTSPFPQPEETDLQADVLWGINQINHTSVIGGVKKGVLCCSSSRSSESSVAELEAPFPGQNPLMKVMEASSWSSPAFLQARRWEQVIGTCDCAGALLCHSHVTPGMCRTGGRGLTLQSLWGELAAAIVSKAFGSTIRTLQEYRKGLWNVSLALHIRALSAQGGSWMWGECCLLEMTSLVGDIPGVGWACASLWS